MISGIAVFGNTVNTIGASCRMLYHGLVLATFSLLIPNNSLSYGVRCNIHCTYSRGSTVGIATGYGPKGRSSSSDRGKIIIFFMSSRPDSGPTRPHIPWVPVGSFPRG
jgi:hypothetical protein